MMKSSQKSEIGQALILIVLGIAGLLGFAALAIDGGRIYTDRRTMRNAADTASLTGAGSYAQFFVDNDIFYKNWDCSGSWFNTATALATLAAIDRAASNGYVIDDDYSGDNNGVEMECVNENAGVFFNRYIDVTTKITAETPSSFAQFVFGGPLIQTVEAVARIRPQTSLGFGNAIVALNDDNCGGANEGLVFEGSSDIDVSGGGVLSVGCLQVNGTAAGAGVEAGNFVYGTGWDTNGSPSLSPPPEDWDQLTEPLPEQVYQILPPSCDGLPNYGADTNGGNLSPGIYSEIRVNANKTANLDPGLYCVTGDVTISAQGAMFGTDITFYITNGNFGSSGGSTISISAPLPDSAAVPPALANVLIYLAGDGEVDLLGNADSAFVGTVYAPEGTIEVGGSGSLLETFNTQLIGYNVIVHGNVNIDLNFNDYLNFQAPPSLDLQR